ncbi:TauD/TfdA family dioxygenase [Paraburkholderia sp. 1N]|uniref:TauD/TfdA family dioxygenase n=1 Tax=Paraburkholderia solitsugae TaxID=2675748 RepID=A0ABX2BT25_9BURK|nr:TauD/TfdA family dioxygenase [Paraburkholderia solitsugae]NPT43108.1 TauD/TfdA family dioxygenase [Paraburkholderia solitsugae]
MTKPILRELITDAYAWKAADLQNDPSWIYKFTESDIVAVDTALRKVQDQGLSWGSFGKEQFDLGSLGATFAEIDNQIRNGRGFALLRGFPVERYSLDELKTIYWGVGVHIGQVISHNVAGDFVAAVTDLALKDDDPNRRNNTTNRMLDPHTDLADVVTLLCVEKAREGGMSGLCSTAAIHNHIVQNHPEYLEALYEGFYHDYRGYGPSHDANEVTASLIPVFEYNNGRVNCAFAKKIIETGAKKRGVPLTAIQQEAINYVHDLGTREDFRIDMMLEPGDIQVINNFATLHSRSEYFDHEDGRKRYLLRMWVNLENSVQLSPDFAEFVRRGIPAAPKKDA